MVIQEGSGILRHCQAFAISIRNCQAATGMCNKYQALSGRISNCLRQQELI